MGIEGVRAALPAMVDAMRVGGGTLGEVAEGTMRFEVHGPAGALTLTPASAGARFVSSMPRGQARIEALRGALELYRPTTPGLRAITLTGDADQFMAARFVARAHQRLDAGMDEVHT